MHLPPVHSQIALPAWGASADLGQGAKRLREGLRTGKSSQIQQPTPPSDWLVLIEAEKYNDPQKRRTRTSNLRPFDSISSIQVDRSSRRCYPFPALSAPAFQPFKTNHQQSGS